MSFFYWLKMLRPTSVVNTLLADGQDHPVDGHRWRFDPHDFLDRDALLLFVD